MTQYKVYAIVNSWRNSTTLAVANVKEAKRGRKKRRPTSTLVETYVKVNQQALQQKINALCETLRLQGCFAEKLSNKGTHSRNKIWESTMKSKHFSSNTFNGGPPSTRIGKQRKLVKVTTKHSSMRKKNWEK